MKLQQADYQIEAMIAELQQTEGQVNFLHDELQQTASQVNILNEELVDTQLESCCLRGELQDTENQVKAMTEKVQQMVPDVVHKTASKDLLHTFAIVNKNSTEPETYPYKVVRVQKRNLNQTLKSIRKKNQNAKLVAKVGYIPNSVNLYNKLKENIKYLKFNRNDICLKDGVTLNMFVQDINKIIAAK